MAPRCPATTVAAMGTDDVRRARRACVRRAVPSPAANDTARSQKSGRRPAGRGASRGSGGHGTRTVSATEPIASGRERSAAPDGGGHEDDVVAEHAARRPHRAPGGAVAPPAHHGGWRAGRTEQGQGAQHGLAARRVGGDHHAVAGARAQLDAEAPLEGGQPERPRPRAMVLSIESPVCADGRRSTSSATRPGLGLEELAHHQLARARQRGPVQAGEAVARFDRGAAR